jgi:hypothetical protein
MADEAEFALFVLSLNLPSGELFEAARSALAEVVSPDAPEAVGLAAWTTESCPSRAEICKTVVGSVEASIASMPLKPRPLAPVRAAAPDFEDVTG